MWGGMFIAASLSFCFGWAVRSLLPSATMTTPGGLKRILLDWGECHRILDHLQWDCGEEDLTPRVRRLADYLVAAVGWPADKPEPSRTFPPSPKPPPTPPPKRRRPHPLLRPGDLPPGMEHRPLWESRKKQKDGKPEKS